MSRRLNNGLIINEIGQVFCPCGRHIPVITVIGETYYLNCPSCNAQWSKMGKDGDLSTLLGTDREP